MRVAAYIFAAQALAAQTVTISGTVTNAISHAPIPEVTVVMRAALAPAMGRSEADGTLRVANLTPGQYHVMAVADGYSFEPIMVNVEAGKEPAALNIAMMPWPGLSGRVLDTGRKPAAHVPVRATRTGSNSDVSATTDENGRYAFERLNPGRYVVRALPASPAAADDGTELAPTYFPNVLDLSGAGRLTLALGNDLSGYDIVLRRVAVVRVSGKVLDERGQPAAGATVSCTATAERATAREDGTFDLKHVRAFDGWLQAHLGKESEELRGFARVTVDSHNVENVTVRLASPVPVRGTVELDGKPAQVRGVAYLAALGEPGSPERAQIGEDGVRFERVYPGRYKLAFVPQWEPATRQYVDSIQLGDRDVTTEEIEVTAGMLPFRVVLKTGGGHVRGTVKDGDMGAVVLVPKEERLRFAPFAVFGIAMGNHFELDNVRPGDYYAFITRRSLSLEDFDDPAQAQRLMDKAVSVRVERNGTATVDLVYIEK